MQISDGAIEYLKWESSEICESAGRTEAPTDSWRFRLIGRLVNDAFVSDDSLGAESRHELQFYSLARG